MLRCPPSRLTLTIGDIAGLETRLQLRRNARQAEMPTANLRWGTCPSRLTDRSITPAENNDGGNRAASHCSKATFCSTDDLEDNGDMFQLERETVHVVDSRIAAQHDTSRPASPSLCHAGLESSNRPAIKISSSHDSQIFESPPELQAYIEEHHLPSRERPTTPLDMNENGQPAVIVHSPSQRSLDPGAPSFVPRLQFAAGVHLSADHHPRLVTTADSSHRLREGSQGPSHLRVRSSFERNSAHGLHGGRPSEDSTFATALPNLDRYPPLRPPRPASRRGSHSQRSIIFPQRLSSRQQHAREEAMPHSRSSTEHLSVAPSSSTSSRSTPNLLRYPPDGPRIHSRSSSLSWQDAADQIPREHRAHSMVSAASGISELPSRPLSPTADLDTEVTAFLMHDSPLDQLSQTLGRLSTSRPRSVGASFERPAGRGRPSLLSGDLFRENVGYDHDVEKRNEETQKENEEVVLPSVLMVEPIDDRLALSMALAAAESPSSVQKSSSAAASSPTLQPPIGLTNPAPKVTVYNDDVSPSIQPQTPADLTRSSRRTHGRSQTTVRPESALQTLPSRASPERRVHRHTYPAHPVTPAAAVHVVVQTMRQGHESARAQRVSRRSNAVENNVEHSLRVLVEGEREVWVSRRDEDGNLDVTPPREGRFESLLV